MLPPSPEVSLLKLGLSLQAIARDIAKPDYTIGKYFQAGPVGIRWQSLLPIGCFMVLRT